MAEPLREELLHILQHSLGLDEHGQGRAYRNHFVTDGESADGRMCRDLVALGFMDEHAPRSALTGEMPWFTVTPLGESAVRTQSPPPPKLTAGQKRYKRFLREDSSQSFGEWLRVDAARQVRA
jgi:hypothetical protein